MLKRLLKGATSLSYHPEGRFNYEDGEIDRAEYAIRDHFDERTISGLSQNEQLETVQVSEPLAAAAVMLNGYRATTRQCGSDRLVCSKLNGWCSVAIYFSFYMKARFQIEPIGCTFNWHY